MQSADRPLPELLQAVDLSQIAVTATVDASGRLGKVSGVWDKLAAAIEEADKRKILRLVVVSADQDDVVLDTFLKLDAPLVRVVKAATLDEAVRKLYEEFGPRQAIRQWEREQCASLELVDGRKIPLAIEAVDSGAIPPANLYQVLPLLREVKRLPRERRVRPGEPGPVLEREDEPGGLRADDILRWEEEIRGEQVTYDRLTLEQLFGDFRSVVKQARSDLPHLVVLGPPGSGKTTLVQYLAWRTSGGELRPGGRWPVPVRIRLLEWEEWAGKPGVPNAGLAEYLASRYEKVRGGPAVEGWRRWLEWGDVFLLLDGLDELPDNEMFGRQLAETLSTYASCPTILTCRTVSFEQHRKVCPDFPVFTLAGLDDAQRDAYIRAYPADCPEDFDPEGLIGQLNRTFSMRPLAANPLLLAILCYVVDDSQGVRLPATRGELYDQAVNKLLARTRRVEVNYPGRPDLALAHRRFILERTALHLFAGLAVDTTLTFDTRTLLTALADGARAADLDAPGAIANSLLYDLTLNSGILRGDPNRASHHFFLHPTVQEFLAAAALARTVNDDCKGGWQHLIPVAGTEVTIKELVDYKAWDPRWQEIITLLAGRLNDPGPLLDMLSDGQHKRKDDYFHHRLALAALCLPELSSNWRASHGRRIDTITHATFSLWWHRLRKTEEAVPHLTRALPALVKAGGQMDGRSLLAWLSERLHDSDWQVQKAAARAAGKIGSAGATPEILTLLDEWMLDPDWPVAAMPKVLIRLAKWLRGPAWPVRWTAARAVGGMGSAAATPEFRTLLAELLRDSNSSVRKAAARAVGGMGSAAATLEILARLTESLRDLEEYAWWGPAAEAVRGIGSVATTPGFLARLAERLRDPEGDVRVAVAEAVGGIGSASATPEILARLTGLLRDGRQWQAAVNALEQLMAREIRVFRVPRWLPAGFPGGKWVVHTVEELSRLP